MLVNCSMLSDHVSRSIWRRDLQLPVYFKGGSGCEDVLSEIALLDKIFKNLTEGSALRSSVSLTVVEGTIVSCSGTSRVAYFCLQTLHPGLTLDGFKDILDWELQRGEAVGYLVSLVLALLRVQEWLLLKSALSVTLAVNGGASVLGLRFCSIVVAVERWVGGDFHYFLQLDV